MPRASSSRVALVSYGTCDPDSCRLVAPHPRGDGPVALLPLQPPRPKPPAGPLAWASCCICSDTFMCTSKNLAEHRSKQTLSPLFSSPSRYSWGMHFLAQTRLRLHAVVVSRPSNAGGTGAGDSGALPVQHLRHELHLSLDGGDLLCRRRLGTAESKERHFLGWWFWSGRSGGFGKEGGRGMVRCGRTGNN